MPVRLMLLFALLTPLAGIVQVERGGYAARSHLWLENVNVRFCDRMFFVS